MPRASCHGSTSLGMQLALKAVADIAVKAAAGLSSESCVKCTDPCANGACQEQRALCAGQSTALHSASIAAHVHMGICCLGAAKKSGYPSRCMTGHASKFVSPQSKHLKAGVGSSKYSKFFGAASCKQLCQRATLVTVTSAGSVVFLFLLFYCCVKVPRCCARQTWGMV